MTCNGAVPFRANIVENGRLLLMTTERTRESFSISGHHTTALYRIMSAADSRLALFEEGLLAWELLLCGDLTPATISLASASISPRYANQLEACDCSSFRVCWYWGNGSALTRRCAQGSDGLD